MAPVRTVNFSQLAQMEASSPQKGQQAPKIPNNYGPTRTKEPLPNNLPLPANAQIISDQFGPMENSLNATPPADTLATLSPGPVSSFAALEDNNTSIPPDTHGAAGPNHLMVTLNTQVRIQTRTGTTLSTVSLDSFFGTNAFDPRIHYDPYNNRWIFVVTANAQAANSGWCIAVSQTSNPTGNWSIYGVIDFDASNVEWADYPTVGFNKNWITIQINRFRVSDNAFMGSRIYALTKSEFYAGGFATWRFWDRSDIGGTQAPAITYNNAINEQYLLQTWNGNSGGNGFLRLYTISGAIGSETLTYGPFISTPNPWAGSGPNAPQLGSTTRISTNDNRMQNVVYRNGSLWAAHTVFLPAASPTRASVQWWQVTTAGGISQRGRIDDGTATNFYAFPSIAVNNANNVLIGYSRFAANRYASANYSFRLGTDAANTLQPDFTFKAGEDTYVKTFGSGNNRWGDYSATVVDPVNDQDFWTIQEYAETFVSPNDRWGTWWARVSTIPVPPAPATLTATALNRSQIRLNWSDVSGEIGYRIYRAPSGGFYTEIATVGANVTTFLNSGLAAGTQYYYIVQAYNSSGNSGSSPSANATTASLSDYVMDGISATTCSGTFYDPGFTSNYSVNQTFTQTFTPTSASSKVRVSFSSFNIENGYDFLRIYNGPSTASPLIGTYTGTTSPGVVTATNATGQLTFQFTSDAIITASGWVASISCVGTPTISSFAPNNAPVGAGVAIKGTNFTAPITVRFNGVAATNISLESPNLVVATIPAGATSGPIQVVSNGVTATSASNLTIGPVTSIWQAKTPVPTARGQHGAIPLTSNGKVYLFGGTTNGSDQLNSMQVYTTNDFAWAAGAPMPVASRGFSYAIGPDRLIYVFGGASGGNTFHRLTPLTNTWTALANIPTPVWEGAAAATTDGKVYVFGGEAGGPTNLTQVYTIATNTWSTAAPMPVALMQHRAVTGYDGKIYVFGGRTSSSGGLSDVVRIYNPASNTWSTGAPMPIAKNQFGTFRNNDGRIFIIGGKASYFNNTGPFFHTVEIYTPSSNSWASGPALIQPVGEMVTMNSIGNVFLMGGATGTYRNFNWRLVLPPVAPSNLVATAVSASQINLTYNDNSGNENRFELERASSAAGPWSVFHTNSPNHPFYNHTGLTANTTIYYRVRACNSAGCSPYSNVTSATTFSTSAAARESVEPELKLSLQASPNPFNQKVVLHFTVEKTQEAKLEIYDLKGVLVERLFEGEAEAGRDYQVVWNAALLKSGFFIGRLASGDKSVNQKLILQR